MRKFFKQTGIIIFSVGFFALTGETDNLDELLTLLIIAVMTMTAGGLICYLSAHAHIGMDKNNKKTLYLEF